MPRKDFFPPRDGLKLKVQGVRLGIVIRVISAIILVMLLRSRVKKAIDPPMHPLLIRRMNISAAIHALPDPEWHVDIEDCQTSGPLHASQTLDHQIDLASCPRNPTGLVPENDHDNRYLLRPRYFESLFWAYANTWDPKYQNVSWYAFLAVNKTCRDERGHFHGVEDVWQEGGGDKIYGVPSLRVARLLRWALLIQRVNVTEVKKGEDGRYGNVHEIEREEVFPMVSYDSLADAMFGWPRNFRW
ncbi:Mannosyl-oligosaccharide alpha-1,2-mannosidase 1B [Lecanosticta acicola]|uniref:Mannosyl-oligosaccharide alpha-1,2-mannosidase 1B n=1 Tax=Lecanosticta acicola TaxID=111012 RepID=A0AAI8Z1Y3_9PEZI|nr:Mannosyl-oligosaccharide alpha-1,2-mannosidase 1B [Lecanosticta acicola]